MSQATISIRVDQALKQNFDILCEDFGISTTAALNIFIKTVVRERRIPFELSADPFYSESNVRYLENVMQDVKTGKAHFSEHELLEEE